MIWLLACTGSEPVDSTPPTSGQYTGEVRLDEVHLDCLSDDARWRIYTRGVGQVELTSTWTEPQDTAFDSADTAGPATYTEDRPVPVGAVDPGGFWALYELTATYQRGQDATDIPCGALESDGSWSVRLFVDGVQADCEAGAAGDCGS
ncbi:MAG: hypothetical protein GY913_33165 [Proteobacteria bacterium]|nr:hypothetical protein [Pseudomonadota bacterium]MCP4921776.1 hypothetical protein [Pseudomonadota bacterium]